MTQILTWATVLLGTAYVIAIWHAANKYLDARKESREVNR